MKERTKKILEYIVENKRVSCSEIQEKFNISKRTVYYDIQTINDNVESFGAVKNIEHKFSFDGDYNRLRGIITNKDDRFLDSEYRKNYILNKILNEEYVTIEQLTYEMLLSKNTIVQTIDDIKYYLRSLNLKLEYKKSYAISGNEYKVRELFILLMQEEREILNSISNEIAEFDKRCSIKLTDYSLINLTKFVDFINKRIREGRVINNYKYKRDAQEISYYKLCSKLIKCNEVNEDEISYLCTYISTLPSLESNIEERLIEVYVDKLISKFEASTAITLESKSEFKKNITRHLLSSYNRIRFKFPISNPALDEVKFKHESLFKIIKSIIENEDDFPIFVGIREEEIGFIAAYFGGYLRGARDNGIRKNKVLVVCPNGLMVSKNLEIQLYKYIPTIDIVNVMSIKQLSSSNVYYDYIISTVDIPNKSNVIVVNPLLSKFDIELLMDKLINVKENQSYFNLELIIQAIKKNAKVINEEKLKEDLLKILYRFDEKEAYQPMLKELITEDRIRKVKAVEDWKEAVRIAAKPLLDDNSIDESYVVDMIESIEKHGPYIVLADRFALPHASSKNGVKKLAMSLLVVDEEVDLLGKPVNIFMVLAAVDNNSYIRALASLSEMLYDQKNIESIINGDNSSILELINKQD